MLQLIREHYPDSIKEFRYSDKWFAKPCGRLKVSLRRKTQAAQETPAEVKIILRKFYKHLTWVIIRGKYEHADIASMDQRGSSFIIDVDKTYEITNSKDVCQSQVYQALTSDNGPCNSPFLQMVFHVWDHY